MFKFLGKVRKGQNRGKHLGFPTANVDLHHKISEGVYLSTVKINKDQCSALTFIGNATTFNENKYHSETYILNFDKDIYGMYVSIKLLKKLRGNVKFKSEKELIKQMEKDTKLAKDYFKNTKI